MKLVPSIPHAHHMYGHELRRSGSTQEAIEQFQEADRLELAYYRSQNIPAEYDWHHMHNLNLLASAYLHEGELEKAEQTLKKSIATPSLTVQYAVFKEDWPEFLLLRGRSEEALQAAHEMTHEKWASAQVIGHALAGEALLVMGNRAQAEAEHLAAQKAVNDNKQVTQEVEYYAKTLGAELLLGTTKTDAGAAELEQLESHFTEAKSPDQWNQNLFQLERIARLAREYNAWDLAKHTAEQMIRMDPYYAGAHFALAVVNQQKGSKVAARREFDEAGRAWRHADSGMPEYAEATNSVKRH